MIGDQDAGTEMLSMINQRNFAQRTGAEAQMYERERGLEQGYSTQGALARTLGLDLTNAYKWGGGQLY